MSMSIFIFKPKFKVRYLGKSLDLNIGNYYIIENNVIINGILFLKLDSREGLYPSEDFEGEVLYIKKPSFRKG